MENITQQFATSAYTFSNLAIIFGSILALIGTMINIWSGQIIRRYDDERIAKNEAITAVAKADAAKATENAALAFANAANATESAALANENAAASNLKANEVEKQNTELRIKFANRRLTKDQYKILTIELSKSPASFNMETMGDPESGLFAADILKAFTDGKWTIDQKYFPLGVIWQGIIIFPSSDPATSRMADALKKAGIEFRYGDQTREKATLMIGGKPPVF